MANPSLESKVSYYSDLSVKNIILSIFMFHSFIYKAYSSVNG